IAAPGLTAVESDRRALIKAEEHPLAVRWIDPGDVRILATGGALESTECLSPVGRSIDGGGDRVNDVGGLCVNPNTGAIVALSVRNAIIARGHMLPSGALIVGAKESGPTLNRSADEKEALPVRVHRNRYADAAGVGRERVDLCPCLTFIGRLVESSAIRPLRWRTTAAKSAARVALRGREDHTWHVERVLDIARAIRVFRSQRVFPCLAAVTGAVDALAVVARVTLCGHHDYVGIFRVDNHLVDLRRFLKPDMRPCLATISRLVYAVAARALHRVARAGIDDVRIGRRDLDRTDAIDVCE